MITVKMKNKLKKNGGFEAKEEIQMIPIPNDYIVTCGIPYNPSEH